MSVQDGHDEARISIHAPHTGSDLHIPVIRHIPVISIHAPHTGSDLHKAGVVDAVALISIHAPHTGSDVNRTRKLLHAD